MSNQTDNPFADTLDSAPVAPKDDNPFSDTLEKEQPSTPTTAQPQQQPFMDRMKQGFVRGYDQAGVGLNQLANDVGVGKYLGVAPQEVQNARAKQLEDQSKGTGVAGWLGETAGNPINIIPGLGEEKAGAQVVKAGVKDAMKVGAKYGAGAAAVSPEEDDTGPFERAIKTGEGALAGAGVSGAITKGIGFLGNKLTGMMGAKAPEVAENQAQQRVMDNIMSRPDAAEVIAKAKSNFLDAKISGVPITMAEALENQRMMTETGNLTQHAETSGQTEQFYKNRAQAAADALKTFQSNLGPYTSHDQAAAKLSDAAGAAVSRIEKKLVNDSQPFYTKAYSSPVPTDPFYIKEMLGKPSVQQAIQSAKAVAKENNIPYSQMFATIKNPVPVEKTVQTGVDEYGQPIMKKIMVHEDMEVPTVRGWDQIKRSLDTQVSSAYNSTDSAVKNLAKATQVTRDSLRDTMKEEIPGYGKALDTYSHNAQEDLPKISKYLGKLADKNDKRSTDQILNSAFSGTEKEAQTIAQNIGKQGSEAAAFGKIEQARRANTESPLTVQNKIGWNDADTRGAFQAYLPKEKYEILDKTMKTLQLAQQGQNRRPEVGAPTQARTAADKVASTVAAAASPYKWVSKAVASIADNKAAVKYRKDLANLMLTDEGQKFIERLDKAQSQMQKNAALSGFNNYLGRTMGKMGAIQAGQKISQ